MFFQQFQPRNYVVSLKNNYFQDGSGYALYVIGFFLNKKQMNRLEKSIASAVSLKVAVGNLKYNFNIDVLVNQKQNNVSAIGEIF